MSNVGALENYIAERCDEILKHDEEYQRLNLAILESEKKIKAKFANEKEDFLKYERLIMEQLTISNIAIYKALTCNQISFDLHNTNRRFETKTYQISKMYQIF